MVYAKKSKASQTIVRNKVRKQLAESVLVSQLFLTLLDSFDSLVKALKNVADEDLNLNLVKERLLDEERKRSDRQGDKVGSVHERFK